MPVPGLSLLGFMGDGEALSYLRNRCVVSDDSDAGLRNVWNDARQRLGPLAPRAGHPDIQDIPSSATPLLQAATQNPRFRDTLGGLEANFKLVEIEPLLAWQFHVETDRSASLCAFDDGHSPTLEEMVSICLPSTLEEIPFTQAGGPNSILIRSRSLNLRMFGAGLPGKDELAQVMLAGITFGVSSPLIHVARFEGRCYLRNGFHRTYGLQRAGATHLPCLLVEATSFDQIGAVGQGNTFERTLLESGDPPTCGHFTQERALEVTLRSMSRLIQVTWSEYVLPDD